MGDEAGNGDGKDTERPADRETPDGDETAERYEGDMRGGKRNGQGTLYFKYGKYEGQWVQHMMCGLGRLELKTGNVYEGSFAYNKFEGKGTLQWKNGKIYVGDMRQGNMTGVGKLSSEDGEYEGEFYENEFFGNGTMRYKNGDVYTGAWKHGMMWGSGVLKMHDGTTYDGTFHKNQKHGKIVRTDPKGVDYSERYARDEVQVSYKVKKPSKSSNAVGKFLSKVTANSNSHVKEGHASSDDLFERPKYTEADIGKQLDKRAKNNVYHKIGGGALGPGPEASRPVRRLSPGDPPLPPPTTKASAVSLKYQACAQDISTRAVEPPE
eukprot:gene20581-31694_t